MNLSVFDLFSDAFFAIIRHDRCFKNCLIWKYMPINNAIDIHFKGSRPLIKSLALIERRDGDQV